jgi:hypothetical protein
MENKIICKNCRGNGYIRIDDETNEVRQCWICESEGEIYLEPRKKDEDLIYDT